MAHILLDSLYKTSHVIFLFFFSLSENFSSEDETLMKAKINFTGTVAGEHPNVLKFIGAVVDDPASELLITPLACNPNFNDPEGKRF